MEAIDEIPKKIISLQPAINRVAASLKLGGGEIDAFT
jgi:hypothetical protein